MAPARRRRRRRRRYRCCCCCCCAVCMGSAGSSRQGQGPQRGRRRQRAVAPACVECVVAAPALRSRDAGCGDQACGAMDLVDVWGARRARAMDVRSICRWPHASSVRGDSRCVMWCLVGAMWWRCALLYSDATQCGGRLSETPPLRARGGRGERERRGRGAAGGAGGAEYRYKPRARCALLCRALAGRARVVESCRLRSKRVRP